MNTSDELQAAVANHFGQRLRVRPIGAVAVGCDGAGRGVERDQRAGLGVDQRKPARERRAGLGEWIGAAGIEHNDVRLEIHRRERPRVVGHAHRFDGDVRGTRQLRVDRHEIVVAFELHAVAAQIDERRGVGAGRLRLVEEIA